METCEYEYYGCFRKCKYCGQEQSSCDDQKQFYHKDGCEWLREQDERLVGARVVEVMGNEKPKPLKRKLD